MKHGIRICLLASALAVAAIAASDGPSDIKAIEQGYRKLERMIMTKDGKGLIAFCTPDFSWTDASGHTFSKKEFGQMMKGQMTAPGLKFHSAVMKNDSYGFMGNECAVRNITTVKMSMKMNGKTTTMTGVSEGVDTWRRTPNGWCPCKVQIVTETQNIGG